MITMRAAVLVAPRRLEMREVPLPEPGPGQVRVRIEGCGVCASNLAPWEGKPWFKYPFAPGELGHEAYGVIEALGAGCERFQAGQRVAMLSYHSYAEYDLAEENAVVALPSTLESLPFPAEPLGCAFNIFRRSGVQAGQEVAIVGIGFLGALLTRLASHAGARVTAFSRRAFALEMAEQMGAAKTRSLVNKTDGQLFDVVFEAAGKAESLELAGRLTAERGRLVVAGYHQDGRRTVDMQLWNWRGIDVINAHERDPKIYMRGIGEALEAVGGGVIDPGPLYTHCFPLSDLGCALETASERPPGFLKALVLNDGAGSHADVSAWE